VVQTDETAIPARTHPHTTNMQVRHTMQTRGMNVQHTRQLQQRPALRAAQGGRSVRRAAGAEAAAAAVQEAASSSGASEPAPTSNTWELDFCSRPLLDERGKKVWELVICDPERQFQYTQYFPNSKINSIEVGACWVHAHVHAGRAWLHGFGPLACCVACASRQNGSCTMRSTFSAHGITHCITTPQKKQLRKALESILQRPGAVVPEKARFFRGQMQTIISKALGDVGIKALPSRRCFSIMSECVSGCLALGWHGPPWAQRDGCEAMHRAAAPRMAACADLHAASMQHVAPPHSPRGQRTHTITRTNHRPHKTRAAMLEERLENVYKVDPRYSDKAATLFSLDLGAPEPLPDALRGEKWAFVQLPLGPLLDMLKQVDEGSMFGAGMALGSAGLADLPRDILVPGVAVFSRRAMPLAAWTNGLEIAGACACEWGGSMGGWSFWLR